MTNDLNVSSYITTPGGTLNINDHVSYVIAGPSILGGTVQWDRKTVSAPDVDGDFTIHRRRTNVTDMLAIYVKGNSAGDLFNKIRTLTDAFSQDRFEVTINIDGSAHTWECEASDYAVELDTAHVNARYAKVLFNILRKPEPLFGGY
jgi:hypothetical protein